MTTFPTAPNRYDRQNEQVFRDAVARALLEVLTSGTTIELGAGVEIVWVSPDGTRWSVGMTNTGALESESL